MDEDEVVDQPDTDGDAPPPVDVDIVGPNDERHLVAEVTGLAVPDAQEAVAGIELDVDQGTVTADSLSTLEAALTDAGATAVTTHDDVSAFTTAVGEDSGSFPVTASEVEAEADETDDEQTDEAPNEVTPVSSGSGRFHALVAVERIETGDRRIFDEEALSWRNLPLPLMATDESDHGAMVVNPTVQIGNFDRFERRPMGTHAEVHGWGSYLSEPDEQAANLIGMVQRGELRGISIDADLVEYEQLLPAQWFDQADGDGMPDEEARETDENGDEWVVVNELDPKLRVTEARIMGATVVPFPTFQEAFIEPEVEQSVDPEPVTAAALIAAGGRGTIVAAVPSDPEALVVEGGDPADQLHVTVGYFGDDPADDVLSRLVEFVEMHDQPFTMKVSGRGWLGPDDATVLFVEDEDLQAVREALVEAESPDVTHPHFNPHLTLGYGTPVPEGDAIPTAIGFDGLQLWSGGKRYVPGAGATDEEPSDDEPADDEGVAASLAGRTLLASAATAELMVSNHVYGVMIEPHTPDAPKPRQRPRPRPVTAAARRQVAAADVWDVPVEPPAEWFAMPEPDEPTAITFTDDGQVYGHLAVWGECHIGIANECVMAPESPSNYARFHTGEIVCADGSRVAVGSLTFSTGHADKRLGARATVDHYDHSGTVGADLVVVDGEIGPWMCGAARTGLTFAQRREMMAVAPSGDWRPFGSKLDLVAALQVPVQGFNRQRVSVRRENGMVAALIMGNAPEPKARHTGPSVFTPAAVARMRDLLAASIGQTVPERRARALAIVNGGT